MKRMTRQPGFTLLELLLAAVVFALVAAFAAIIFASTVRLELTQRQSQALSLQGQSLLDTVSGSLKPAAGASLRLDPLAATSADHGYGVSNAVTLLAPKDSGGVEPVAYCVQLPAGATTKRFVRLTFSGTALPTPATVAAQCAATTTATVEYLTDTLTDVVSFQATPVWSPKMMPSGTGAPTLTNPPAVSLQLILAYGGEARKNDSVKLATRTVLRTIVDRSPVLNATNL